MSNKISEIIGWYGAMAVITAFALVSFQLLAPNNIIYLLLNATGALGIIYISFKKKAFQPGVVNIIWLIIAVANMVRLVF